VPVADTAHLVDTCGTGGDSAHTFNISTAATFVAAGAGARVAKHGGRSVSSKSGSADVLEALGVNINMSPEQVATCIAEVGLGFMFAPNYHSAMKHAAPVRKEMGVRTLFNILGPLTNPAGAPNQVMGVFHPDLVGIQVRVLQRLGSERALTVFGREGLDEISISGETLVGELRDGEVREYVVSPEQFGLSTHDIRTLQVATVEESRDRILKVLRNEAGRTRCRRAQCGCGNLCGGRHRHAGRWCRSRPYLDCIRCGAGQAGSVAGVRLITGQFPNTRQVAHYPPGQPVETSGKRPADETDVAALGGKIQRHLR
jgi:anthranilate phosphoribosyltransferase